MEKSKTPSPKKTPSSKTKTPSPKRITLRSALKPVEKRGTRRNVVFTESAKANGNRRTTQSTTIPFTDTWYPDTLPTRSKSQSNKAKSRSILKPVYSMFNKVKQPFILFRGGKTRKLKSTTKL